MARLTDRLNKTIADDWDVKPHTKQTKKLTEEEHCISIGRVSAL